MKREWAREGEVRELQGLRRMRKLNVWHLFRMTFHTLTRTLTQIEITHAPSYPVENVCATPWAIWGTWLCLCFYFCPNFEQFSQQCLCLFRAVSPPLLPLLRHKSVAHVSEGCHRHSVFRSPMRSHTLTHSLSLPLSFPPATTAEAVEKILSHCSKSVWKLPAVKHILLARIALWIIRNIRIFRLPISFFVCVFVRASSAYFWEEQENPIMWIIMQISRQNESKSIIDVYILRYL